MGHFPYISPSGGTYGFDFGHCMNNRGSICLNAFSELKSAMNLSQASSFVLLTAGHDLSLSLEIWHPWHIGKPP